MRTEKEIIDMFVRVADCFISEEYKCPFIYTCIGQTDDSCRDNWTKWLKEEK